MQSGKDHPTEGKGQAVPPVVNLQQVIIGTPVQQVQAVTVTTSTTAVSPQILGGVVTLNQAQLARTLQQNPGMFLVQQQGTAQTELQMACTQVIGMTTSTPPAANVRVAGGTIHHLGQSPPRGVLSPLGNPQRPMMQNNQQSANVSPGATTPRRTSTHGASALNTPGTPIPGLFPGQAPPKSPIRSPGSARKRLKLEEKPPLSSEIGELRKKITDGKFKNLAELKDNYNEHLTEMFFLQSGLNIMDYPQWKKRPTVQLVQFLKSGNLDSDDEEFPQEKKINDEVKVLTTSGGTTPLATPVAISTQLPAAVTAMHQQGSEQNKKAGGRHGMVFGHVPQESVTPPAGSQPGTPISSTPTTVRPTVAQLLQSATASHPESPQVNHSNQQAKTEFHANKTSSSTPSSSKLLKSPTGSAHKLVRHVPGSTLDNTIGSQEAIVERAKQEAQVMQKIAELRKEGMWSLRRLPKVQEAPRGKAHWDYLLEEMQWLAADFAQERKWKKAGARKIARMIAKHFQEIQQKEIRAEKEEGMKLKRIATTMSKMVKEFWNNIEKVVQYKQQSRLEEKRKKALDLHLSFIVDQTEKYSSWLTEGLASTASSIHSGSIASTSPAHSGFDDGDFEPERDESDDEETIAKEEAEAGVDEASTKMEIDELQKESELPLEELLKKLPKEVLEKPASVQPVTSDSDGEGRKRKRDDDDEFDSQGENAEDEEETLEEQETHEVKMDHSAELKDLADEGDMPIEELMKKYAGAYDSDFEMEMSESSESSSDSDSEESIEESSEEDVDIEEEDLGMEQLLPPQVRKEGGAGDGGPNDEITDIAEQAMRLQPTGYTLETTSVKTTVPFLIKHTLREYQHVGLDWLATMNDRRLNGILADEMGLGKTIQTIALLAHLACDHGIWGPHLIVVPTSVMLNWEMELKKWCPGFKILTYYGNQKERKLKRQGWTKTNAFHVCITSYKLVIQDHQAFRRKKWKYFILDEAQNIKNFKSQRWQTLLNFSSQRRLLLTGTPLQNSLMELWSLMHFLMPHVFASHREFKEWFSNPLSGMIEGSREYNENLIRRLHKVLRPFLLRRLKHDVEKQLPKKYEHVVMCRLSKRQRYLYDDFMSQTKTKETLATGHFMSVINILMQLRKVCNHPNLFDPRPVVSPFQMEGITYTTASAVLRALEKDPLEYIDPCELHPCLADLELKLPAFAAHRIRKLGTPRVLIEEIDECPSPPPRPKSIKLSQNVLMKLAPPISQQPGRGSPSVTPSRSTSSTVHSSTASTDCTTNVTLPSTPPVSLSATPLEQLPGYTPTAPSKLLAQQRALAATTAPNTPVVSQPPATSQPISFQIQQTDQGTRLLIPSSQLASLPGILSIVQTQSGQQIITSQAVTQAPTPQKVLNGPVSLETTASETSPATVQASVQASRAAPVVQLPSSITAQSITKPVMRVAPMSAPSGLPSTGSPGSISRSQVSPAVVTASALSPRSAARITRSAAKHVKAPEERTIYFQECLSRAREERRSAKLRRIANSNKQNCDLKPVYGADLVQAVTLVQHPIKNHSNRWQAEGYSHCYRAQHPDEFNPSHPKLLWGQTEALTHAIKTPSDHLAELKDILQRFVFVTPTATAPSIKLHASHQSPSAMNTERRMRHTIHTNVSPKLDCLHKIVSNTRVQFPELRLIQYDCGKLQTLDILLRKLKVGHHRVLLFTQMTKMLDVLEQFLNFHGHRYLRLDGTTRVEQRQMLMDRFNMDKRIFVFILSTRSGGIGVNLTGADTVIFYDSDWNPTMDAQAQDRCHRIGQTRDVHIYRLISNKTIEENILKKANQKRLMTDVAIEGGNFTTAFFKENSIQELFEEPSGLEALEKEKNRKSASGLHEEVRELSHPRKRSRSSTPAPPEKKGEMSQEQIEQALGNAEDDTDVQAAKVAKAEQKAELAEFDEDIPWDEKEEQQKQEQGSKLEQELAMLEKELTPVERFALLFLESQMAPLSSEELENAEKEVEIAKEEWELSRLQALKEEEELRASIEEDEMLFTYAQDEGANQVKKKGKNKTPKKSTSPQNRRKSPVKRRQSGDGDWEPTETKTERKTPRTPPKTSTPARVSNRKIIPTKKIVDSTGKPDAKKPNPRSALSKKSPKTPTTNVSKSSRTRSNSSFDTSCDEKSPVVRKRNVSTPNESPVPNVRKKTTVIRKPVLKTPPAVSSAVDATPSPKPRILQSLKMAPKQPVLSREANLFENMAKPVLTTSVILNARPTHTLSAVSGPLPTVATSVITKLTNIVSTTQQPKLPSAIAKTPLLRTTNPVVQNNLRIESVNRTPGTVQYVVPSGATSLITNQNGPAIRTIVNPVLNSSNSAVTRALLGSKITRPAPPRVQIPQVRNQTLTIRNPTYAVQGQSTTTVPVVNQQVMLRGPGGVPLRGPIQLLIPGTGKTILVNPSQIISSQNKLIAPAVTSGIRATTQRVNVPMVQTVKQVAPTHREPILSQPWTSQNFVIRTQRPATITVNKAEPVVIPAPVTVPINNSTILVKNNPEQPNIRPDNTVPILEKMALQLSQGATGLQMETINQNNNHTNG